MARDIVSEAVKQAEAMKSAAYENAKSVLVEAMSTNLKAAVTEAIDEKIDDAEADPVEDEQVVEDLAKEAAVEEGDWGGNKGDESKSRRDFEEDEDEEEIADDAYDEDDDAGDEEGEEDLDEMDIEEVIEIIEDDEEDDEDEDIDVDVDVDTDDDDDEEVEEAAYEEDEEYGGNKGDESRSKRDFESAIKENKSLKKENARYAKALTFLKKRIDEVNLFNARLAAASDVMKAVTLTKEEKETVVEHFDSCKSVNEIKRTFQVLTEAYKANDKTSKKVRVDRPNVQSVISEETQKTESDSQFDRMAQLAGLK